MEQAEGRRERSGVLPEQGDRASRKGGYDLLDEKMEMSEGGEFRWMRGDYLRKLSSSRKVVVSFQ